MLLSKLTALRRANGSNAVREGNNTSYDNNVGGNSVVAAFQSRYCPELVVHNSRGSDMLFPPPHNYLVPSAPRVAVQPQAVSVS